MSVSDVDSEAAAKAQRREHICERDMLNNRDLIHSVLNEVGWTSPQPPPAPVTNSVRGSMSISIGQIIIYQGSPPPDHPRPDLTHRPVRP